MPMNRLLGSRSRACKVCGAHLVARAEPKYDPFWVLLLIFAGSMLAFFLLGILVMAIGWSLFEKQERRWECPSCFAKAT